MVYSNEQCLCCVEIYNRTDSMEQIERALRHEFNKHSLKREFNHEPLSRDNLTWQYFSSYLFKF